MTKKPTVQRLVIRIKSMTLRYSFEEIYNSLTKEDGWIVKSQKNKAKVKSFGLEPKRSCTVQ